MSEPSDIAPTFQPVAELHISRPRIMSDDLHFEGDSTNIKVWFTPWDEDESRFFLMDRAQAEQVRDYLTAWLDND